jgi:lincosamide nucleotidyltransferase A/C/D/E
VKALGVAALYDVMQRSGIPTWLFGGWGVDALLGRQTREHHDVDLLVEVSNLERFEGHLNDLGFEQGSVWDEEARWVHHESWSREEARPTAFVDTHPDGREIDVHVVREDQGRGVEALWNAPYPLPADGLSRTGVVAGRAVPCVTFDMQRIAHTGYDLAPHHVQDLKLLEESAAYEGALPRRRPPTKSGDGEHPAPRLFPQVRRHAGRSE